MMLPDFAADGPGPRLLSGMEAGQTRPSGMFMTRIRLSSSADMTRSSCRGIIAVPEIVPTSMHGLPGMSKKSDIMPTSLWHPSQRVHPMREMSSVSWPMAFSFMYTALPEISSASSRQQMSVSRTRALLLPLGTNESMKKGTGSPSK